MTWIVGLTGGIGSGKSTVARHFAELGIYAVDADDVAREVVMPGEPALAAIFSHFGPQLRRDDGSLDRAALRQRVFDNSEQRRWLEQLLHPLIRQRIIHHLQQANSPYALLVSPLLLETDQHQLVDHVLVVDIPERLQIERATTRDHNSSEQIKAIIAAQISRDQRLARADSVLDNSAPLSTLEEQVQLLDRQFRQQAAVS